MANKESPSTSGAFLWLIVSNFDLSAAISQMMDHKRISTTHAYLANLRKSKMDEYQDEIYGKLSG